MIRVFIADDHAIVRDGLRRLLEAEPDMVVVGEACNGREVLLAAEHGSWDLLLLDLSLPRVSGLETVRRLRVSHPELRIVVLSMYPEEEYAVRLVREGAAAYLAKDRSTDELLRVLRGVMRHGRWEDPEVIARARLGGGGASAPHTRLSPREYQVFTLLFQGRAVTEIAAELDLGVSTVSNFVRRIKDKLGVETVGEIVSYAHRAALVGDAGSAPRT